MLNFFLLLIVGTMGALQLPGLIRKKWWKEVAMYSILLIAGTVSSFIALKLIEVSSPFEWIAWLYRPINRLFD
ncbi:hypothetical protein EBB07_17325 [Paenibacillaceae bacterium]|nr:hypothetical protein EBB07_17325 [Paenibacillaceae bacterium]